MNQTSPAVTESKPKALTPMDAFRKEAQSMEAEFSRALPPHIPRERFIRVLTTAVQTSMASNFTNLLECDRRSLWQAAMRAAQDGLLPDGREAVILKYGDKGQYVPMVAGIRKKARNSGEISVWDVHCVYKNDTFTLRLGDAPSIDHTYDLATPRGELIGSYSVAVLKDGTKSYEVMSMSEIRAIRDRSVAWTAFKNGKIKSTPWGTDEAEMARKTVAKRHSKQLPSSADLDDLIRRDDDLYDFGKTENEPTNVTRLKSPKGKSALDQFASEVSSEKTIEHEDKPSDTYSAADAYAEGAAAYEMGKTSEVPAHFTDETLKSAWLEGWKSAAPDSDPPPEKEAAMK